MVKKGLPTRFKEDQLSELLKVAFIMMVDSIILLFITKFDYFSMFYYPIMSVSIVSTVVVLGLTLINMLRNKGKYLTYCLLLCLVVLYFLISGLLFVLR